MLGDIFPPDITTSVRTFYLASAAAIIAVRSIPPLRDRFLDYGARSSSGTTSPGSKKASSITKLLDRLATLRVSHSYFVFFYAVSAALCVFWFVDLLCEDPVRVRLSPKQVLKLTSDPAPIWKPGLSLGLLLSHSLRRVYENLYVSVPNPRSTMWIGHFAVGLAFFLVAHLAIIAEYTVPPRLSRELPTSPYEIGTIVLTTTTFYAASVWQYRYHAYLASLRKYTLPEAYGARYIVAPHYTADCLIYFCLAVLDARSGPINWTVMSLLAFVVVNLGVTADGTKTWMLSKFRDQQASIQRRWRMLPGLW